MESLIAVGIEDIRLVWVAYAVSVLCAYGFWWAWIACFISHPYFQGLILWPFWVVLFSVSPIALGHSAVAPTIVVTIFAIDGDKQALIEETGLWWLVGALSGVLFFLMMVIVRELWKRFK